MFEQFHFLRPFWLIALLPLAALIWQLMKSKYASGSWRTLVDPELLHHLLTSKVRTGHKRLLVPVALVGIVAVIALAGPTWEKVSQPVYKQRAGLVIALDLSRSMDVNDIKPSRLTRARHKIADILSQRRDGQTGLIAYAADAFVVTPLTEDVATINALLPSLSTDIMPAQGGRADRAVGQALDLFNNTGVTHGDILIVTDGLSTIEVVEIERLVREYPGFRISVLGIGTESGGPISLASGGFLKDSQGSIVIARMQIEAMRELTRKASGVFSPISVDDNDILAILNHVKSNPIDAGLLVADQHADIWREQGPLLILALLPLMSLAFRRGVLLILPLLLLPYSPDADAMSWDELWQNQNQRGSLLFDQGDHDAAANLFGHAQWKASSLYRAGKYDQALQFWSEDDSGDSQYNSGNALAKLGRYEDAIRAYQQVLDANPQHQDASYNKRLIEERLQQQQQNQDDKNPQESGDSSQDQNMDGSQQQAQSESDSSQPDQQNEQNSAIQKPRSEQQDGTEAQASQAQQPESSEESSPGTDATEIGGEDGDEMSEQAANQWLRKIPDDPGGLLRRKFLFQYKSRGRNTKELNQW